MLAIIVDRLLFFNVWELFSGGARIGEVLSDLALAYLASFVFY